MNRLRKIATGLGASLVLVVMLHTARADAANQDPQAPPNAAPAQVEVHDESELKRHMEIIEESMSKLRRSIRKPEQNAVSFELLTTLQLSAVASKAEPPAMLTRVPEAERTAFLAAYRKEMIAFTEGLFAIESALLDGDHDAARAAHKRISALEDTGHERFTDGE